MLHIMHVGDTNMITFILESYMRWRNKCVHSLGL